MHKTIEIVFDILYLLSAFTLGITLIAFGKTKALWGVMALVLAFGDSFHLIPRIISTFKEETPKLLNTLAWGKMITSITMTVFYMLLWHLGLILLGLDLVVATVVVYIFAVIRIGLCLLPQNKWTAENPSYLWSLIRNIPFLLIGIATALLYGVNRTPTGLRWMWLAVLLSFLFYIPVVLFAPKNPKWGMLMLPKSCVYIWIIAMGFLSKQLSNFIFKNFY